MEFDRKGPGGGLEIYCTVENGRALLEYKAYLRKAVAEELLAEEPALGQCKEAYLDIRMWDRESRQVFGCRHPLQQEESAKGMLLHPHLWQGTEDPYLYRVRVSLMEKKDYATDTIEMNFAFRSFREIPRKGWFLNDRPFSVKAVAYVIPDRDFSADRFGENKGAVRIRQDLELIKRMGANTICPVGGEIDKLFCEICDEKGLLLWCLPREDKERDIADIPHFYGRQNSLLTLRNRFLTERYYYYKACWSEDPFVYISAESLMYQGNGNVRVTVYSNQKKVALYVEGILFEFKTEGPDFVFEEIPVKRLPLMLTAETGECSMSVTAWPT